MENRIRVQCIKTSYNTDNGQTVDYRQGAIYDAEVIGDDILVANDLGEMCLAGITAKEAVNLGMQETEDGYWDSWFNEYFCVVGIQVLLSR